MMHNPPHPGLILREDVLPALGLSVTEAADQLGVSRVTLSRTVNGNAAISAEMALRLEQWLGSDNGGSADMWLRMQAAYDLWQVRQVARTKIPGVKKAPVARAKKAQRDVRVAKAPTEPREKKALPRRIGTEPR
jgi:antitoxin HigA-1